MPTARGPVVLVLFDGWGYRPEPFGNAVAEAETPNYDQLWEAYPHVLLQASGAAVGLSQGTVGSAIAGYSTIAAGRPVPQPSAQLDEAVADGSFCHNEVLVSTAREVIAGGGRLHLLGLVSDGQVVSSERHYFELLALLQEAGIPGERVLVHAVLDGHDTPPKSGMHYLARFAGEMMRTGVGRVATLLGRGFGLARSGGWEATERAYAALVDGVGRLVPSAIQALQAGYSRGEDDATLSPSVVLGSDGLPLGRLADGDGLICFNHRDDGLERLLAALCHPEFDGFRRDHPPAIRTVTLTAYSGSDDLGCAVAFAPPSAPLSLGARLTSQGKRLAVVGESVMSGPLRRLTAGAVPERLEVTMLPSPGLGAVAERPERLTDALTERAVALIAGGQHDFLVVEYVNVDLAGHVGQAETARRAIEALDAVLPPLVRTARKAKATILLGACYGNVEELSEANAARPNPAHTTNPVPLILINDRFKGHTVPKTRAASLADVAPTVLGLLDLPPADDMTGRDLVAALQPVDRPVVDDDSPPAPVAITALEGIDMVLLAARQAQAWYLTAAGRTSDADSAVLYRHLAQEEERRLRQLDTRRGLLAAEHAPLRELPADDGGAPWPEPGLTPLEVLAMAIEEEMATYRILTDIASRNLDPQGRVVLEQLATEERELLDRLQKLSESEALRLLSLFPASAG